MLYFIHSFELFSQHSCQVVHHRAPKCQEPETSGVFRILFRGGVQKFSGKVGVIAWREARGAATRLLGGFGGMLPRENF